MINQTVHPHLEASAAIKHEVSRFGVKVWFDISLFPVFRSNINGLRLYHLLRCLNYRHGGRIDQSIEAMAFALNLTGKEVKNALRWLKRFGLVERYGKTGAWHVVAAKKVKEKHNIKGNQVVDVNPVLSKDDFEAVLFAAWVKAFDKVRSYMKKKTRPSRSKWGEKRPGFFFGYEYGTIILGCSCNTLARYKKNACSAGLLEVFYEKTFSPDPLIHIHVEGWHKSKGGSAQNGCSEVIPKIEIFKRDKLRK